ncbi:protein of unknown function [Cupriavidus neocaledonicus]|uniref:Uncharacterized protein n=1 Tax=Cupriavidus neocaledonicus TaxID=1040979 RepID=A0A375H217_9BURK|nr:hypothetical protein CBM2605_A50015 [Cupriavidus neocaledonicus]SPD45335.1 protein of unknown function [Cupriavidus neocaledonicus]
MLRSPARWRGAGVRAGAGLSEAIHFVATPALTPTLSQGERGYTGSKLKVQRNIATPTRAAP